MNSKAVVSFAVLALALCGCGPELAPPAERDAYLGHVELAEVRVGKTLTGRYNVYGEIHNRGDRPLTAVVLKVELLDKDGNSLGAMMESGISDTLHPKTKQEFRIPANDAPEDWAQKVEVKVAELAFGS